METAMARFPLVALTFVFCLASARAGEPGDKVTIAYIQKLQTPGGGFLAQAPSPEARLNPTLKTTSTGVRVLHYLGDAPFNKATATKFIASCYDAQSGGFAD